MGRAPSLGKTYEEAEARLKKGAWSAEEDQRLMAFITKNKGHGSWRTLPKLAGLERSGKSCRLRWTNYLRPDIKHGNFSADEERIIVQCHALLGNKWSAIASYLAGRTDNEVKNHWNTHLRKRLANMGIDPITHLPLQRPHANLPLVDAAWQAHLLQWSLKVNSSLAGQLLQREVAKLEAEARHQIAGSPLTYIQNCSATCLPKPPPKQVPPFALDALLGAANTQSSPIIKSNTLPNVCTTSRIHDPRTCDESCSKRISPSPCHEIDRAHCSNNAPQEPHSSTFNNQGYQDNNTNERENGGGSIDTVNAPASISSPLSHLLDENFELPPDLVSPHFFSDETRKPASDHHLHLSSPTPAFDPFPNQRDTYWAAILDILD